MSWLSDFMTSHDFFFKISNHTLKKIKDALNYFESNNHEVKWVCEHCGYEEREDENLAYCPKCGMKMIPLYIKEKDTCD